MKLNEMFIQRERLELSQAEVARRAKVSTYLVAQLERGLGNPRLDALNRICEVLELEVTLEPTHLLEHTTY